jgi:hypothetical protein
MSRFYHAENNFKQRQCDNFLMLKTLLIISWEGDSEALGENERVVEKISLGLNCG